MVKSNVVKVIVAHQKCPCTEIWDSVLQQCSKLIPSRLYFTDLMGNVIQAQAVDKAAFATYTFTTPKGSGFYKTPPSVCQSEPYMWSNDPSTVYITHTTAIQVVAKITDSNGYPICDQHVYANFSSNSPYTLTVLHGTTVLKLDVQAGDGYGKTDNNGMTKILIPLTIVQRSIQVPGSVYFTGVNFRTTSETVLFGSLSSGALHASAAIKLIVNLCVFIAPGL